MNIKSIYKDTLKINHFWNFMLSSVLRMRHDSSSSEQLWAFRELHSGYSFVFWYFRHNDFENWKVSWHHGGKAGACIQERECMSIGTIMRNIFKNRIKWLLPFKRIYNTYVLIMKDLRNMIKKSIHWLASESMQS